ncbi:MAG: ABC transporter permease subunit [Pseudomonadota bacterium]
MASATLATGIVIAVPMAIIASQREGAGSKLPLRPRGAAIPPHWLGLILILNFAVKLAWLPAMGARTPALAVLPALTLCIGAEASLTRIIRSGIPEARVQPILPAIRRRGVPDQAVGCDHVAPHASVPVLTVLGLDLAFLLEGRVVLKAIFGHPVILPPSVSRTGCQAPRPPPPFRTNALGHEILSRLLHAARWSPGLAFLISLIGLVVGTTVGLIAALGGKIADWAVTRATDTFADFPELVAPSVIAGLMGAGMWSLIFALSVSNRMRHACGIGLSLRTRRYVVQAKLAGLSGREIARWQRTTLTDIPRLGSLCASSPVSCSVAFSWPSTRPCSPLLRRRFSLANGLWPGAWQASGLGFRVSYSLFGRNPPEGRARHDLSATSLA